MPRLSSAQLLTRVVQALRQGGASVEVVSANPPFDLLITSEEEAELLRIHIWNVTPGGRELEGELRIQVTRRPLTRPDDGDAVLLGWHEDTGTFVAFDLELHAEAGASASVQVQLETLKGASSKGMALQRRGSSEVAVAVRPENLAVYIDNKDDLHQVGSVRDALPELGLGQGETGDGPALDPAERDRITAVVTRLRRDASFRSRVLSAYDHACCVCDLQLGLIEAAHIVPVTEETSTDETSNGLALCVLHHRAYDTGLLAINEDGSVAIDPTSLDALRREGLGQGEEHFRNGLRDSIRLPAAPEDRPSPEGLAKGRELRGG